MIGVIIEEKFDRIVLLDCANCFDDHWKHPGGRCAYSPFKYEPDSVGWSFIGGRIGRVVFNRQEDAWQLSEGVSTEYYVILTWIFYLCFKDWYKPFNP